MKQEQLQELWDIRKRLNDRDNLLYSITYCAAPVIEGIKPSALLNLADNNRNHLKCWRNYGDILIEENSVKFDVIYENEERCLVLLFDEEALNETIKARENLEFLWKYGYADCLDFRDCMLKLRGRFNNGFPHEVGIFLGYPLEDVRGFIKNRGRNYLINGYWKVYNKPEEAKRVFKNYDRAIIRAVRERFM